MNSDSPQINVIILVVLIIVLIFTLIFLNKYFTDKREEEEHFGVLACQAMGGCKSCTVM